MLPFLSPFAPGHRSAGSTLLGQLRFGAGLLVVFASLAYGDAAPTLAVDATFDTGDGADAPVLALAPGADGSVWIGGQFTKVQGVPRAALAKLAANGQVAPAFAPVLTFATTNRTVLALERTDTGVLVGGALTQVNGKAAVGIAQLKEDGSLDPGFTSPFVAPSAVSALKRDPSGNICVAGILMLPGRSAPSFVVRLHADGSLDPTFAFPDGLFSYNLYNPPVLYSIALDARGRLILNGDWSVQAGYLPERPPAAHSLASIRVWPDGGIDASFVPIIGNGGAASCVCVQDDGRLLFSGELNSATGSKVVRLQANGDLDTSFAAKVEGPPSEVYSADALLMLPSQHLLIGGDFTAVQSVSRNALAILRADGSLSGATLANGAPDGSVVNAALAADGGILIAGDFTHVDGASRGRIAKLRFAPGAAAVTSISIPTNPQDHENIVLRAMAEGTPPLTYTWSKAGQTIAGATNSTLAMLDARTTDSGSYSVRVQAADNTVASATTTLTIAERITGRDAAFKVSFLTDGATAAVVRSDGALVLGVGTRQALGDKRPPTGTLLFTRTGEIDPMFGGAHLTAKNMAPRAGGGGFWIAGEQYFLPVLAAVDENLAIDSSFSLKKRYQTVGPVAPTSGGGVVALATRSDQSDCIIVLKADGTPDSAFAGGAEVAFSANVTGDRTIAATPDRWVYVGSAGLSHSWRCRPDGTQDTTFPNRGYFIVPSADGEVYLLDQTNGSRNLVKVGRDGAFDTSYRAPNSGWSVATVDAQGRAWGVYQSKLVRLLPSGDLDPTFAPPGTLSPLIFGEVAVNPAGTDAYLINFNGMTIGHYVSPPAFGPASLVNLSSRAQAGTGADALIAGYVTSGESPRVLLRAIGPSLRAFGIGEYLQAARLQLYRDTVAGDANEAWDVTPGMDAAMSEVGAFRLPARSLDAALFVDRTAGAYTAWVTPQADISPGVAVVEMYVRPESDPTTRLLNVSTRARVSGGEKAVILGFVIRGDGERQVLIRGVGPGLSGFGVPDLLSRPVLTLYHGSTAIAHSTGWDDTPAPELLWLAMQQTGAFPVAAGGGDVALLVRLPAGTYTAGITSAISESGIVIAEVYDVSR